MSIGGGGRTWIGEWKENRTFKLQDLPAVVALLSTMAGRRTRFGVYGMMKLSGRREGKGETEDHGMLKKCRRCCTVKKVTAILTSLTWSFPSRDQLQLHDLHRR
jgi:hypothetical protein